MIEKVLLVDVEHPPPSPFELALEASRAARK